MGISVSDIVTGRKTFFILPDTSLIPTSYLEDYFALGYECYFVEYDKRVDVKKKVEIIDDLWLNICLNQCFKWHLVNLLFIKHKIQFFSEIIFLRI